MNETQITLHYDVDGTDFTAAGSASVAVKKALKQIGIDPEIVRKTAIALYEGEINMVIHANGGTIDVRIEPTAVYLCLADTGPGIPNIDRAMQEGYSTASDRVRELGFGAGMGLPNMKKYTDELKISTELGKGTTLNMRIDLDK